MRINGPSSSSPASARRRTDKSNQGFAPERGASAKGGPAQTSAAGGVSSIDALLALQGEAYESPRERATGRAFALLDILDEIKIALLEGGVPRSKLHALLGALDTQRDDTCDSRLETVLDEVETRARVELAKHQAR